jgi:hypothetical protein
MGIKILGKKFFSGTENTTKKIFSSTAFLSRKKFLPLVGGWGVYNILLCIIIFVYLCS